MAAPVLHGALAAREESIIMIMDRIALALAITGHVWLAMADPHALRGMVSGKVPPWWARQNRPGWYQEQEASEERAGTAAPGP